ncbi:hypothetical protein A9Q96_11055 [Rhodobacterales bacterium 52_120_T64]|nr:hypothetical protein A9Q96_11055 [Rhodobacterales bacterium 52_120_T64]
MFDSFTTRGRVRSILKLLAEERNIILKGPLSDLQGISARRDKLVDGLVGGQVALTNIDLAAIHHQANRNQNLLKASISGVRAAKALLSEQNRAAATMGTYTDSGERLEVPQKGKLRDWIA